MVVTFEEQCALAYKANRRKIAGWCRKRDGRHGWCQADLEGEMYEVLVRCVRGYDPSKGSPFNPFLWRSIKNRYIRLIREAHAQKRDHWMLTDLTDSDLALASDARREAASAEDWYFLRETAHEALQAVREGSRSAQELATILAI